MVMLFRSPPAFSAPDPSILFAPLQYHQPLKMCRCKVSFQSGMELKIDVASRLLRLSPHIVFWQLSSGLYSANTGQR